MTDREVLIEIHNHMLSLGQSELQGRMHDLRRIISKIPKHKITISDRPFNDMASLEIYLEKNER